MLVRCWFKIKLLILCGGMLSSVTQVSAETIKVAVASNFYHTLQQLLGDLDCSSKAEAIAQSDCDFVLSSGATGTLFSQITHGAPFDIFFAADVTRPKKLEQMALTQFRQTYTRGKLVFWSTEPNMQTVSSLQNYKGKLVIANEKLAPFGKAAMEVLATTGLMTTFSKRLLRASNINQAFQFVDTGNANVAFLSESQMIQAQQAMQPRKYQNYQVVEPKFYMPIEQQVVILKKQRSVNENDRLRKIVEYIASPQVQKKLANLGYQPITNIQGAG